MVRDGVGGSLSFGGEAQGRDCAATDSLDSRQDVAWRFRRRSPHASRGRRAPASSRGSKKLRPIASAPTPGQKQMLAKLSPRQIKITELAGEPIERILDRAPGNGAPIGGIKVVASSGWFAARPSGTEDISKIYAESFRGPDALRVLLLLGLGVERNHRR
jgi:hypothetical protein